MSKTMSKTMGKRVVALLCCFALLFCAAGTANVQAKSGKTVYVVTKVSFKTSEVKGAYTYSYNKRGLINKVSTYMAGEKYLNAIYKYDSKKKSRLKKISYVPLKDGDNPSTVSFVYTSKGQIKQIKNKNEGTYTIKVRKNGKATSIVNKAKNEKYSLSYNKKGHVKKAVLNLDGLKLRYSNSYDKKGNLVKDQYYKYKNTYKNGRLVKSSAVGAVGVEKYTYKKITVPAKYYKKVKKQQWAIKNELADPVGGLSLVQ